MIRSREVLEKQAKHIKDYQAQRNYERELQKWQNKVSDDDLKIDQAEYRRDSVCRVLDYICSHVEKMDARDISRMLVHCHNKLMGNIDGIELTLDEEDNTDDQE